MVLRRGNRTSESPPGRPYGRDKRLAGLPHSVRTNATCQGMFAMAVAAIVRAIVTAHPIGGAEKEWPRFPPGRFIHLLGMSSGLLWDKLDVSTQLLVARTLGRETDRFLDAPAPAQLSADTRCRGATRERCASLGRTERQASLRR